MTSIRDFLESIINAILGPPKRKPQEDNWIEEPKLNAQIRIEVPQIPRETPTIQTMPPEPTHLKDYMYCANCGLQIPSEAKYCP